MQPTILILPGLFNSGDGHWQTLWESMLPGARRVQQENWDSPNRADWVASLDAAIKGNEGPVVLAAHSLGCALVAWWASRHGAELHAAKVKGALLVAPPDVEREEFSGLAVDFAPMPSAALGFKSIVAASSNDPWCALPRARAWATAWGAQFIDVGPRGHINGESGLSDWAEGRDLLAALA